MRLFNSYLALWHSGIVLSLINLASTETNWIHYVSEEAKAFDPSALKHEAVYGHIDQEIEDIHFFGITGST
jgi:hypothetical protein